jgi:hypothetical protein
MIRRLQDASLDSRQGILHGFTLAGVQTWTHQLCYSNCNGKDQRLTQKERFFCLLPRPAMYTLLPRVPLCMLDRRLGLDHLFIPKD